MSSPFEFKKKSKSIGDFSTTDEQEWNLLIRERLQEVTTFIHFRKMWLIEEVEEDEENEIAEQKRNSNIEVNTGFIKDGNFVIERRKVLQARTDEEGQRLYLKNLAIFVEDGYRKDWLNYEADGTPKKPKYYGTNGKPTEGEDLLRKFQIMSRPPGNSGTHPVNTGNPHIMMKAAISSTSNNQNQP